MGGDAVSPRVTEPRREEHCSPLPRDRCAGGIHQGVDETEWSSRTPCLARQSDQLDHLGACAVVGEEVRQPVELGGESQSRGVHIPNHRGSKT